MSGRYVDESLLIPAGEHIQDWIDAHGMPIAEFCDRMGISRQSYNRIAKGEQPISLDTAVALEHVTGVRAEVWLNLEAQYRIERRQLEQRRNAEAEERKIKAFLDVQPIRELIARGVFPSNMNTLPLASRLSLIFDFYGVSDMASYAATNGDCRIAARSVRGTPSAPCELSAWVHLAMREAEKVDRDIPVYDEAAFRRKLPEIVRLSAMLNDEMATVREYLLKVKEECAKVGVAVVYVKKLKGVKRLNGVAFWLNGRRPAIALTLHNKTVDGILFSFLHEAGHILNDRHNLLYMTDMDAEQERSAENFAAEIVLPARENARVLGTRGRIGLLTSIARQLGIAVELVVGRYHYLTRQFTSPLGFKPKSISWDEIETWTLA